jgi:putative membrane protein (TIGR04086 family)
MVVDYLLEEVIDMEGIRSKSYILKAATYSFLFTFIAIIILSMFVAWGNVDERNLSLINNIITFVGVFMCSFICGRGNRNKGLLMGLLGSTIYFVMILIFSGIIYKGYGVQFSSSGVVKVILIFIIGTLGGIIAINTGGKSRSAKRKRY